MRAILSTSTEVPQLTIDGIPIEIVDEFNFLGITINKHFNWNHNVDKISSKIWCIIGIINRMKNFLPQNVLVTLYNSLVLPHINYGLVVWGYNTSWIIKLQKRAIRLITMNPYNTGRTTS